MVSETYDITKLDDNNYIFTTKNSMVYQIALEDTSMTYKDGVGALRKIYEISLKGSGNAPRDMKTGLTVVQFIKRFLGEGDNDAVMYRVHNKIENVKGEIRRGRLRQILFDRLVRRHGAGYIKLSNSVFGPPPDDELLCVVINMNTPNYKRVVESFYKFCGENT